MKTAVFPLILGLAIGFIVTAQLKSPRQRILNPVEPVTSLVQARESLTKKTSDLKQEIKLRREEITALEEDLKKRKRASEGSVARLNDLKVKAGLTEIKDRGAVVTLADAPKGEVSIDAIVHSADIRDVVNVLTAAGAYAVAVNDERVVATTSIDSAGNPILVNNVRTAGPFVIKAAGDPKVLADSLAAPDNLADIARRQKLHGLVFNVEKGSEVTIPPFTGSFVIKYAQLSNRAP